MCMQPIIASMRQIAVEEKKHDMNSSDHLLRGKEYFQEALGINNTFFQFEKPKQVFLYLYVNLRSVINPVMLAKGNLINEKKNSSLTCKSNMVSQLTKWDHIPFIAMNFFWALTSGQWNNWQQHLVHANVQTAPHRHNCQLRCMR